MIDLEIIKNFQNGIKKKDIGDPLVWMSENVKLPFSQRSTRPDIRPWMKDVLITLLDPKNEKVCFLGPTGAGKTTMLNIFLAHVLANDPSNCMFITNTQSEAEIYMTSQFESMIKGTDILKPLIPTEKGKNMKMHKVFPAMNFWAGSQTLNFLQSKSCRYILHDEVWCWDQGMIEQANRRHHDHWLSKGFYVSQASEATEQNDWHDLYNSGNVHEWFFKCPKCGKYHYPDFVKNMKFEIITDSENVINWHETNQTIKYVCPECGESFNDTITNRSNLANSGRYELVKKGREKINSYHINILACPNVEWSKIVDEIIVAENEFKRGFDQLKKNFWLKRLANFWKDEDHFMNLSTFEIAEIPDTEKLNNDGLLGLILSNDIQKDHIWSLICGYYKNGDIIPIHLQRNLTFEEVAEMQEKWNIPAKQVIMDARYRSSSVFDHCGKNGWIAIMGSNKKQFLHNVGNAKIYKPYSTPQITQGQKGNRQIFLWTCSPSLDNMFFDMKESGNVKIPKDADPVLVKQLNSTIRKTVYDAKGRSKNEIITRIKDNHAFDCFRNSFFLAHIRNWLPGNVKMPDPSEAENESEKDLEEKDGSEGQKVRKYQLNQ